MTPGAALSWLLLWLAASPNFTQHLSAAKKALKARDYEAARKHLTAAEAEDPAGREPDRFELLMAQGDLELAESHLDIAARRFALASHAAEDDAGRRRASLQRRLKVAQMQKDKRAETRLRTLSTHDEEVRTLLRRPRVDPKELFKAESRLQSAAKFYQRDKDPSRAAWARALATRVRAYSAEDAEAALVHASKAVHLVSRLPAFVQVAALEAALQAARRSKQEERELEFALRHNVLVHRRLPEEERPFARTPALEEVCRRYEKNHGAGACALRSRELTGTFSFVDFSTGKPKEVLSPEDLAPANAQYLPAVKECVERIARENAEDELFEAARVTVEWVVAESGRVADLSFAPKRYDRYFGECVRSAAAFFRYPRSKGERQTVSVSFELSAPPMRQRRGG